MKDEHDCTSCGACCAIRNREPGEYLVDLTAKDEDRLTTKQLHRLTLYASFGTVMKIRPKNGYCVARRSPHVGRKGTHDGHTK